MRLAYSCLIFGFLLSARPVRAQAQNSSGPSKLVADPMAPGPLTFVPPPVHGPSYGEGTTDDFGLTYHGYLSAPLLISLGEKKAPPLDPTAQPPGPVDYSDRSGTPIHSLIAALPDAKYNTWFITNSQPAAWAQATFGIGTRTVEGTILIGAWNFSQGQQVPQNALYAQSAVSFWPGVTFRVDDLFETKTRLNLVVGGTGGRYGTAGKYDSGFYGTPVVAGIFTMGELIGLERDYGDVTVRFEEGFGGNGHGQTDPVSTTLTGHAHVMASYKDTLKGGVHYIATWTQDDRSGSAAPDGSMKIIGADARFNGGIYGELFVGGSYVKLSHAQRLDGSVQVVHVAGGQAMMDNFLGVDPSPEHGNDFGTGSLSNFEVQYDYSFGALAKYPQNFWGDGPDLRISLFGLYTKVGSFDPIWDNVKKLKVGTDILYTPFSWFGLGVRLDAVLPNLSTDPNANPTGDDRVKSTGQNFSVISPRIILRSQFAAHETIGIQYSHYFYSRTKNGDFGQPIAPNDHLLDLSGVQSRPFDSDVFSLKGTMWF